MDYCNGKTHHWSDDSYACGNYPCPGWPSCTSDKAKAIHDALHPKEDSMEDPNGTQASADAIIANLKDSPSVALTVSIPVTVGGYTGQRSEWEEFTREFAVSVGSDGRVSLQSSGDTREKISFNRAGLEAALKVLAEYETKQ